MAISSRHQSKPTPVLVLIEFPQVVKTLGMRLAASGVVPKSAWKLPVMPLRPVLPLRVEVVCPPSGRSPPSGRGRGSFRRKHSEWI